MNTPKYDSEFIQRYLLKQLTETEQASFEKALQENHELKAEVEQAFLAHQAIIHKRLFEVKELLNEVVESKPPKRPGRGPYIIGSILLGIGIAGSAWWYASTGSNNKNHVLHDGKEEVVQRVERAVNEKGSASTINKNSIPSNTAIKIDAQEIKQSERSPHTASLHPINNNEEDVVAGSKAEEPAVNENEIAETSLSEEAVDQEEKDSLLAETPIAIDPCEEYHWDLQVVLEPSCLNQQSGSIDVYSKSHDVQYALENEALSNYHRWDHLGEGDYAIRLVSDIGCDTIVHVAVEKGVCTNTGPDYAFYLAQDEFLIVENPARKPARLSIRDRSGNMIFEQSYEGEYELRWNPESTLNRPLQVGYYFYTIHVENGDLVSGGITVLP